MDHFPYKIESTYQLSGYIGSLGIGIQTCGFGL